jgi:hypothetical protein
VYVNDSEVELLANERGVTKEEFNRVRFPYL